MDKLDQVNYQVDILDQVNISGGYTWSGKNITGWLVYSVYSTNLNFSEDYRSYSSTLCPISTY